MWVILTVISGMTFISLDVYETKAECEQMITQYWDQDMTCMSMDKLWPGETYE